MAPPGSFDNRLATSFRLCRPSARATLIIQSEGRIRPHHPPHPPSNIHPHAATGASLPGSNRTEIWTFRISAGGENNKKKVPRTDCGTRWTGTRRVRVDTAEPGGDTRTGTQLLSLPALKHPHILIPDSFFFSLSLSLLRQN